MPHPHHLAPPEAAGAGGAATVAGGAGGFTPFHNVNCPFGFIIATSEWEPNGPLSLAGFLIL